MYPKSVLEEVAQAVDSNQIINLEDWSITFNEFQPDRNQTTQEACK
jgi:hypothetical protein